MGLFERRKFVTSILLGLAGFVGAFFSLPFNIPPFSITILWSYSLPLLAGMAYGGRYGFMAGVVGLGAMFPFFLWKENGWGNVVSAILYLCWFILHGHFASLNKSKPAAWNYPLVIQLPFAVFYAASTLLLYPIAFAHNPPFWAPGAETFIPDAILSSIITKATVLMFLMVMLNVSLLKIPLVRNLLGLDVNSESRKSNKIILGSLVGFVLIWYTLLIFNRIFIEQIFPQGLFQIRSSHEVITLLVLTPVGIFVGYLITGYLESRIRVEDKLQKSEVQLANAMRIAKLGHWELDVANGMFTFSDNFYEIFHTTAQEMGGYQMSIADYARRFVHPEDSLLVEAETHKAIETTDPGFNRCTEHRMLYADGSVGYIAVNYFIVKDQHGKTIKTYGVNQDITERKRADEMRARYAAEFEALYQTASEIAGETDLSELLITITTRAAKLLGAYGGEMYLYDEEHDNLRMFASAYSTALVGTTLQMGEGLAGIVAQSRQPMILDNYSIWEHRSKQYDEIPFKAVAETPILYRGELIGVLAVYELSDSSRRFTEDDVRLLSLLASGIGGVVQNARDITKRKRAEEALRESHALYETLTETSPVGIWQITPDRRTLYANPAMRSLLELDNGEDIIGRPIDSFFTPDALDVMKTHHAKRSQNVRSSYELELTGLRGRRRTVFVSGAPLFSDEGKLISQIAWLTDITERKQAEERITKERENFLKVFAAAPVGLLLLDQETVITQANLSTTAIVLRDPVDIIGQRAGGGLGCIDSLENTKGCGFGFNCFKCTLRRGIESVLDGGPSIHGVEIELTLLIEGVPQPRWLSVSAEPIELDNKQHIIVALSDVTERKRAEETLHASEERHRAIIQTAQDGFWIVDMQKRLIQVNDSYCRMSGYSVDELLAMKISDLEAVESTVEIEAHNEKIISQGGDRFETRHRRKDGSLFDLEASIQYRTEAEGSFICFFHDITERKRNEQINASRLHLLQFAAAHSLDELLEETLNETEKLTGSTIGFYHFVGKDQQTLSLQNWSTRTKAEFCKAVGTGLHYDLSKAGAWVDCVHQRQPVIHNDYASLPHRKGMPEGHAEVIRELVVPVFRGENVAAILGVGNKPSDYNEQDIKIVSLLADLAWEIAERKQAELALQKSEDLYRRAIDAAGAVPYALRHEAHTFSFTFVGEKISQITGFSASELNAEIWKGLILEGFPRGKLADLSFDEADHLTNADSNLLWECDFLIRTRDGHTRWIADTSVKGRDEKDGSLISIGIFQDITERKQRERGLEAIARVSSELRTAPNRAQMLPVIIDQIVKILDCDSVTIEIIDPKKGEVLVEAAHGVWQPLIGLHQKNGTGLNAIISQMHKPYHLHDLENESGVTTYPDWARKGIRGCVGVQLIAQEKEIGYIWVGSGTDFNEAEIRLLISIADITANAIHRATLHEQTVQDAADLALAYDSTLEGWARALELRDQETEGHARRVVQLTLDLAQEVGIQESCLENIRRGALLHDIGKMGIPDSILLKPGMLDEREWEIMRRHPEYAFNLLNQIDYLRPAIDIPYCHHERWDGTGYPRGLKGEEIPMAARVFAIVDAWDALSHDRPYRLAWPREAVVNHLKKLAGKQFDPQVVEKFIELLATK
jgi:PAS domain S-box-containing protein